MEWFQPGSPSMVTGKWNTLAKMRCHMWPCQLTVLIELQRMTFTWTWRNILRDFNRCFTFRQCLIAFPRVIPYRTVIRKDLAFFIIGVTRFPLWRKHILNPVFNIYNWRIFGPIAFSFSNNFKLLTKPVHGFTN